MGIFNEVKSKYDLMVLQNKLNGIKNEIKGASVQNIDTLIGRKREIEKQIHKLKTEIAIHKQKTIPGKDYTGNIYAQKSGKDITESQALVDLELLVSEAENLEILKASGKYGDSFSQSSDQDPHGYTVTGVDYEKLTEAIPESLLYISKAVPNYDQMCAKVLKRKPQIALHINKDLTPEMMEAIRTSRNFDGAKHVAEKNPALAAYMETKNKEEAIREQEIANKKLREAMGIEEPAATKSAESKVTPAPTTPKVDPVAKPVPTAAAPKVETVAKPAPAPTTPKVDPVVKPAPTAAAPKVEAVAKPAPTTPKVDPVAKPAPTAAAPKVETVAKPAPAPTAAAPKVEAVAKPAPAPTTPKVDPVAKPAPAPTAAAPKVETVAKPAPTVAEPKKKPGFFSRLFGSRDAKKETITPTVAKPVETVEVQKPNVTRVTREEIKRDAPVITTVVPPKKEESAVTTVVPPKKEESVVEAVVPPKKEESVVETVVPPKKEETVVANTETGIKKEDITFVSKKPYPQGQSRLRLTAQEMSRIQAEAEAEVRAQMGDKKYRKCKDGKTAHLINDLVRKKTGKLLGEKAAERNNAQKEESVVTAAEPPKKDVPAAAPVEKKPVAPAAAPKEHNLTEYISAYANEYKKFYSVNMGSRRTSMVDKQKRLNSAMKNLIAKEVKKVSANGDGSLDVDIMKKVSHPISEMDMADLVADDKAVVRLFAIASSDGYSGQDGKWVKLTEKRRTALAGVLVDVADKRMELESKRAQESQAGKTAAQTLEGVEKENE